MSDSESDIEVPDTEEKRGFVTPAKGKPISITSTNMDMWIVCGPRKHFVTQFLDAGEETTITPKDGKVGIITKTKGDVVGKQSFTVNLYEVKPKTGDKLEAEAESKPVEALQSDGSMRTENKIRVSLSLNGVKLASTQQAYDEAKIMNNADIAKKGLGLVTGVLDGAAAIAGMAVLL